MRALQSFPLIALLPAVLALAFATVFGTLFGAASVVGAIAWHLTLVAFLWTARDLDPLRLGPRRHLLPWLLCGWLVVSAWASPVSRAGLMGLVLVPCLLFAPAVVAAAWEDAERRRRGVQALALAVGLVAAWGLLEMVWRGGGRAAMPLGHHGLLAAWLLALLPMVELARGRSKQRLLGHASLSLGVVALVMTRSFAGMLGLFVELVLLAWWRPRWRRWVLAGACAAVLLLIAGRALRIGAGDDLSARARGVYLEAGWQGFRDRPLFGWGPGSVPWTIGLHLEPVPGVNPPSEVVGQLHSLPLAVLYELGLPGLVLVLALVAAFVRTRGRDRVREGDTAADLRRAGLLGLAGAGITALFNDWTAVPAVSLAVALAAGAALVREPAVENAPSAAARAWPRWLAITVALAVLLPLDLAHGMYDRARAQTVPPARAAGLERAVRLDARFPLYQARRGAMAENAAPQLESLLAAAEAAPGVGAIWTTAGHVAAAQRHPQARALLEHALAIDPLGSFAAFDLALLEPVSAEAPACLARALLAEPRLAGALRLAAYPALRTAAIDELLAWDGIDPGWREAMAEGMGIALDEDVAPRFLALGEIGVREEVSLIAFRRYGWPDAWFATAISSAAAELDLPPASELASSQTSAFPRDRCSPKAKIGFDSGVTPVSH